MHRFLFFVGGAILGAFLGYLFASPAGGPPAAPPPAAGGSGAASSASPTGAFAASSEPAERKPAAQRHAVSSEDHGPVVDTDASFGVLLYGQCRGRDGEPVEGCSITFTDAADKTRRRTVEVSSGHGYALTGLSPGTWSVYSKPEGFNVLQTEVVVEDVPTQRVDFTYDRAYSLTVKMVDADGKPLQEAIADADLGYYTDVIAVATRKPLSGDLPMTEQRSHWRYGIGRWRAAHGFEALRRQEVAPAGVAGTIELSVAPPVHVSAVFRHAVLATQPVAAGQDEVTLTVPIETLRSKLSTIRMQLVDGETGAPVVGRVGISDAQSGGGGKMTDDQGRIALANERIGILELDIWAEDYERFHQLLRVEPGENDLGQIRIFKGRQLHGVVVDASGVPKAATLMWQNLDRRTFPQPSMWRRTGRADAEGKFDLPGLGVGRYLVQAFVKGMGLASIEVDTARQGSEPLRLTLRPVTKLQVEARGMPRTSIYVLTIYDPAHLPVWASFIRGYPRTAELPAGRYTYEIHDGEHLVRSGRIELTAGTDASITVP